MQEQITITSETQVNLLLQMFTSIEVLVPGLSKQQHLILEALRHKPLWEQLSETEFKNYKQSTIEFQSKIMGATLDAVMSQMKTMFDNMSEMDERILRENFYIKTHEYKMLGKGMQQAFYLINSMTGAIARPNAQEYKPAN